MSINRPLSTVRHCSKWIFLLLLCPIISAPAHADNDSFFANAVVESFESLGSDLTAIERNTKNYSGYRNWVSISKFDVTSVGAGACAIPATGYATIPAEFLYLMREIYNSAMGVGYYIYGSPEKDDFANILAVWTDEIQLSREFIKFVAEEGAGLIINKVEKYSANNNLTSHAVNLAYEKATEKMAGKLVTKKAGAKTAGKISTKVATKAGAKIGAKYAAKAATAWIPFVSAAVCGGINYWIMDSILDASVEYYFALNRIEDSTEKLLRQRGVLQ